MAIGNWGKEIVFTVSDSKVLTFRDMNHTAGSEWASHRRTGLKDQAEYLRPALQKLTFTMILDAAYGVRPRDTLELLTACAERGDVNTFVIGGRPIGRNKWRITDLSEAWEVVYNKGELARAKVNVTMEEYL